ncbi:MAG: ribbon-helix-helix domain-containing protein [Bdellovibrionales bacterium]
MSSFAIFSLSQEDSDGKPVKTSHSTLISRNITVSGHRTSVRLEPQKWQAIRDICRRERATIHDVCTYISTHKDKAASLTAAIRVYIMEYFRIATTEEGHALARHGQGLLIDSGVPSQRASSSLEIVAGASHSYAKADAFGFGAGRSQS